VTTQSAEKKALRKRILAERSALSPHAVEVSSRRACERVLAFAAWQSARRVGLYCATDGEVALAALDADARQRSVEVTYPRWGEGGMTFRRAPLEALERTPRGILAPRADAPEATGLDVILVPGVAFSPTGQRLGQGGGYYDRALKHQPQALRLGICHSFQVLHSLPLDEWDEPVDVLVTELGLQNTAARPQLRVSQP
jgi:5-formyltetrahydrofolate cyclo-ligase